MHTALHKSLAFVPTKALKPSGASGGWFHAGTCFKVEKAHFAARRKGPESRKNEIKLRPPLCPPLIQKHSMIKSHDSHRRLQKYITSQTCIAVRGLRVGRWIRRWVRGRWICIWGAPDSCPKSLRNPFVASALKIGTPQKRRFNDYGSNAPFAAL